MIEAVARVLTTILLMASAQEFPHALPKRPVFQLQSLVDRWQKRLPLKDWRIAVSLASQADLVADTVGDVEYNWGTKTAHIRVLDPADNHEELSPADGCSDCENTILHELLHVVLSRVTPPTGSDQEEQFIEDLTQAFLALPF